MDTHSYMVRVDGRGRVVLPAALRERLGLHRGDTLVLSVETDGTVRLLNPAEAARAGRGLLRRLAPAARRRSLAKELIAERRAEARRERRP